MMEGFHYARKNPALAVVAVMVVGMVLAVGILAVRVTQLVADLKQETDDRIQLTCDMSFANGQALLDTASSESEVAPEIVELYRRNLQKYTNETISKYDPEFECKIPEVTDAANS